MRRWLRDNLESLLFAFILALSIWMAGVSAADPIEERIFPVAVPIQFSDPAEGFLLVGQPAQEALLTLRAPISVWEGLAAADLHLSADLSALGAGAHAVPLAASVDWSGARITLIDPGSVEVTLEEASVRSVPVRVLTTGEAASRYRVGVPQVEPSEVDLVGPASLLEVVVEVVAPVDLEGVEESLDLEAELVARDAAGEIIRGLEIRPTTSRVRIEVSLPGGFRSVAVLPQLTDQVESGYRVTNVEVTPPTVVVFSSDPVAVENLPGFVQSEPISLEGAVETLTREVSIELPSGFSVVDEQAVVVEVTIQPILSSITVTRPVEVVGLQPGLFTLASPAVVSVLLDGPLPVLENLRPEDVRIVADLLGLGIGTHVLPAEVIVLPQGVTVGTILPDTIEVTISRTSFATPTPIP